MSEAKAIAAENILAEHLGQGSRYTYGKSLAYYRAAAFDSTEPHSSIEEYFDKTVKKLEKNSSGFNWFGKSKKHSYDFDQLRKELPRLCLRR